MSEILCHPWVTHTSFPKYIDHKFADTKTKAKRRRYKKSSINSLLSESAKKDSIGGIVQDIEHQIEDAIQLKRNDSFVVGLRLNYFEVQEKLKRAEIENKKKIQQTSLGKIESTNEFFSFKLLKDIFNNPEETKAFKKVFCAYTLNTFCKNIFNSWKIGLNFSTNIKKLIKSFFLGATKLKLKIYVVNGDEYKFRCVLLDSLGGVSDQSLMLQIYDNIGEYVFDFKNESFSGVKFLLICFQLLQASKS